MRHLRTSLAALVVLLATTGAAQAQVAGAGGIGLGTVGGGWAVAPGLGGGFYGGYPYGPAVAFSPGPYVVSPYANGFYGGPAYPPGLYNAQVPMTVNTMQPLMYTIRRTTGRRQGW